MTIFTVNVDDVIRAADKARTEGRLGFQNPEVLTDNDCSCLYRYPDTNVVCGIGAGLTDEQFEALKADGKEYFSICDLKEEINAQGDFVTLIILQERHDSVVGAISTGCKEATEDRIADFNRYLDHQIAKLPAAA